jgi:hypothetical protein
MSHCWLKTSSKASREINSQPFGARAKADFPPRAFGFGQEGILAAAVEKATGRGANQFRALFILGWTTGTNGV